MLDKPKLQFIPCYFQKAYEWSSIVGQTEQKWISWLCINHLYDPIRWVPLICCNNSAHDNTHRAKLLKHPRPEQFAILELVCCEAGMLESLQSACDANCYPDNSDDLQCSCDLFSVLIKAGVYYKYNTTVLQTYTAESHKKTKVNLYRVENPVRENAIFRSGWHGEALKLNAVAPWLAVKTLRQKGQITLSVLTDY